MYDVHWQLSMCTATGTSSYSPFGLSVFMCIQPRMGLVFFTCGKRATCYGNVDGWQAGLVGVWLSVTAGIVSERLNLFQNCLDHLVAPSFKDLVPLTPIPNSKGNPFSAGIKYTVDGRTGDFSTIFDGYRRLYRKRCAIGRRLLRNVNRNSCAPDWMT